MIDMENMSTDQKIVIIASKQIEQDTILSKLRSVVLEGNGEPSLREKVRSNEKFIDSVKFWLKTVAIAIITQTVAFTGAAVIYFIKLYPLLEQLEHLAKEI